MIRERAGEWTEDASKCRGAAVVLSHAVSP